MNLLVLNYEYPPLGGGAGVITRQISERLALLGHRVTVVTTWFEGTPEAEEQGNLTIIRLKSRRKYTYRCSVSEMVSWIMHSKRFLNGYCQKNSVDVCLANFSLPGGEVALYISKRFSIPYLVLSHGHDIPWMFPKEMFAYHLLTFFRIKKICSSSAYNILLTAAMKKNADKFLGEVLADKNIIIPNGCDFEFFMPSGARNTSCFRILFTGRLVRQKDPFVFLKALKLLSEKGIKFKAKIIGDGIMRKVMEKFIHDNLLSDSVEFTGWVSKEIMRQEYQSTHVFVQTSRYEAMSVASLEALASGTYLLCTPVGANQELIIPGVTGELIGFSDHVILAEKLQQYYQNFFLKGKRVDKHYIDSFIDSYGWDNIILKYEKILLTACAK